MALTDEAISKLRQMIILLHGLHGWISRQPEGEDLPAMLANTRVERLARGLPINRPRRNPSLNYRWLANKKSQELRGALTGLVAFAMRSVRTLKGSAERDASIGESQRAWNEHWEFLLEFRDELRKMRKDSE